jgi:hypothetical protein
VSKLTAMFEHCASELLHAGELPSTPGSSSNEVRASVHRGATDAIPCDS